MRHFKHFVLSIIIVFYYTSVWSNNNSKPLERISVSSPNPYNSVTAISEDCYGMLWIATHGDGLYQFDGDTYIKYSSNRSNVGLPSNLINDVISDSQNRLWLGTQRGVCSFDRENQTFIRYAIYGVNDYVRKMSTDHLGRVFAITQEAILELNSKDNTFEKIIPLKDKTFRDLLIDDTGSLMVVYQESIDKYSKTYDFVRTYSLPYSVKSVIYHKNNTLYINSHSGIKLIDCNTMATIPLPEQLSKLNNYEISSMSEFGDDAIIFISKEKHFYYVPKSDNLIDELNPNFPYNKPLHTADISFVTKGKNVIWAVSASGEAYLLQRNGKHPFETLIRQYGEGEISEIVFDGINAYFIYDNSILIKYSCETATVDTYSIPKLIGENDKEIDINYSLIGNRSSGKLFIVNNNQVFELDIVSNGKISYNRKYEVSETSRIYSATIDKQNDIWASRASETNLYYSENSITSESLQLKQLPIHTNQPRIYISRLLTLRNGDILAAFTDIGLAIIKHDTKKVEYITLTDKYDRMYIQALCEDKSGNIWVGTSAAGLFVYNPTTGVSTTPVQFFNKAISSIALTDTGEILVASECILYQYNKTLDKFSPIWKLPHHILDNEIMIYPTENGSCLLYSGKRLFYYNPSNSSTVPETFSAFITDYSSNIIDIVTSNSNDKAHKLILSRNQTNLIISCQSPSIIDETTQCRYRISKFSDGWKTLSRALSIPCNNLSYGRHRVEIQLTNINESSASEMMEFLIIIKRPWLMSIVAILFYLIFIISAVIIILKQYKDQQAKILEAQILRKEMELQEKMNEDNSDFFANMSHEFRTPLTIISGAAKSLEKEKDNSANRLRLERIIQRNSDRMLKLVSQMLDFNKIEHDKLLLNISKTDVSASIRDIIEQLTVSANEKCIKLTSQGVETALTAWIDLDKFEKIMYNLLSNAIKFTPVNGNITVTSEVITRLKVSTLFNVTESTLFDCDYLKIAVADDGIGIPKDSLEKIFERFVQSRPSNKYSGTGIGLYFAKQMVDLHHGFIKAESENGSVFTFVLPKDESAYSDEEKIIKSDNNSSIDSKVHLSEYRIPVNQEKPSSEVKVMLIDDDVEIISLLKSILSPLYEIRACYDAMSGYKQIEEFNPDIIISDIMMIDMDGLQFCKMVKGNIDICHIPIILLTAKDTIADQIEGLNCGAEAYIVKPFEPEFLVATIKSLLRNRENLHHMLGASTKVEKKVEATISHRDRILMDKLYALLEKSLSNPEMNIIYFAEELGVSRTKLFYKVKALTGMTPSDFFTKYKLNRSIEYIKEDKYKISAIAEMCGFNSPSHFSSLFKKQFGVLPRDYMNSIID